jgi:hypothetical protein
MRRSCALALLIPLLFLQPAAQAGQDKLAGTWKITFWDNGDLLTFWAVTLEAKGDKVEGKLQVVPMAPAADLDRVTVKDGKLLVTLKFDGQPIALEFQVPKGETKKLRGTLSFGGMYLPATLEPIKADAIKDLKAVDGTPEPAANFKELKEDVVKFKEAMTVFEMAEVLVRAADRDKVSAADLKAAMAPALEAAKLHGPGWAAEVQFRVAGRMANRAAYAAVAEELVGDALKATAGGSAETRLRGLGILATSLQKQGKKDDAGKVAQEISKLEVTGHEDNEKAGLGFEPGKFAGRKGNKVVLVELFTGAQCPPCVAADLAFEGLAKTYQPSEVVLLQYHLHIPGPDPLTSEDTVARQKYYGKAVRGTPSIFFNGKTELKVSGGGGRPQAGAKYKDYRGIIDPLLDGETPIKLAVLAERKGEVIDISANASGYKPGDKLRLRFALVEPWVRFPGNNGLSYHAHVVRALPGGADGFALDKDSAKPSARVNLGELRQAVSKYLDSFESLEGHRPFNYRNLRVVAFIQDDDTQEVLHAVEVPVK